MMPGLGNFQQEVFSAHRRVANRGNVSGEVLVLAYSANGGNFASAVTAALGTLGGLHGPLQATQEFLEHPEPAEEVGRIIEAGRLVPGWGSSFAKGCPDPEWHEAHMALREASEELYYKVQQVTMAIHHHAPVFPNPSCYTACLSILMGLPSSLAVSLFLEARLPSWRKAVQTAYHQQDYEED